MNFRLIIAGAVTLALACAPASVEGQRSSMPDKTEGAARYSGHEVGPTPVGTIPDVRIKDAERNRDLELTIDYPTRGTGHPLIILSPGYGGSHRGYIGLATYWAGNNYVVLRLNHADSMTNIQKPQDVWTNATPADWRNRVRDITYIIDSIPALVKQFPELDGKIDADKIAVAGHSYGAHTAMLVGGARTFPGGVSYADPRVKAILAMSPQGPAPDRGFTAESFAELKVPAMFMTGTADRGQLESETPEWRSEAFRLAPAGDKWLVSLTGAGNVTFAGGVPGLVDQIARERGENDRGVSIPIAPDPNDPGTYPGRAPTSREAMAPGPRMPRGSRTEQMTLRQRDIFAAARGIALTFFDTYLRGDAAGREALQKVSERKNLTIETK